MVRLACLVPALLAMLAVGCSSGNEPVAPSAGVASGSPPAAKSQSRLPTASAAPPVTSDPVAGDPSWTELPVLAVWRRIGSRSGPGHSDFGPALRAALWDDGRAVFAQDLASWRSPLVEGRVPAAVVKTALERAAASGVFDLPGNVYLVPDAPMFAMLIREGGRQQMLYWDEVETPGYGINIDPKPQHLAFKRAWHSVNAVLTGTRPAKSVPFASPFAPPTSWYVKEAIQSE